MPLRRGCPIEPTAAWCSNGPILEWKEIRPPAPNFTPALRALGVPVRQNIAVTGSVNQWGEVQAIGGVNQKIEGYYEICKVIGLTGEQGCMIPESNVRNLMLKEELVEAIRAGKFHIWPIKTIDQGIEVLTGRDAGQRMEDGSYPGGTINALVQERMMNMAEAIKEYNP